MTHGTHPVMTFNANRWRALVNPGRPLPSLVSVGLSTNIIYLFTSFDGDRWEEIRILLIYAFLEAYLRMDLRFSRPDRFVEATRSILRLQQYNAVGFSVSIVIGS